MYRNTAILFAVSVLALACQPEEQVQFTLDGDYFEVNSEGGSTNVEVISSGSWVAAPDVPWITVSPANGRGTQTCRIIVDSALVLSSVDATRQGVVTIETDDWQTREITVVQQNYGYTIAIDENEVTIPDYEALSDRYFEVKLNANIDFAISYLDADGQTVAASDAWIEEYEENPTLTLNKGNRPRNVTLRFNWDINQYPDDRITSIVFTPVDAKGDPIQMTDAQIARLDRVTVTQTSAAPKPDNARAADSTALVAISRALNVWSGGWDTSIRMERWDNVTLWKDTDEGCPKDGAGRVRYARFFMFNTDDGIPYQVEWLDAAEELIFYSNENFNFREHINLGESITKLHQLKRLTLAAYGLDNESFPDSFWSAFPNLEYLNLSSNNFEYIDDRFNQANFPALRAFMMRNSQKRTVYDLSNAAASSDDQFATVNGGLYRENLLEENIAMGGGFPVRFLLWDNLDTLQLTLNYLQGTLPTDAQVQDYLESHGRTDVRWTGTEEIPYWEDGEDRVLRVADSLAVGSTFFTDTNVPKVLPRMKSLAINLNRFHGELSLQNHKWILYHPNMDWWEPSTFVFIQEGTDREGNAARFTGVPASQDYYYQVFTRKRFGPDYEKKDK